MCENKVLCEETADREYDVVVVGGGVGGCAAAIAAGRRGARTVLVEQTGILGGQATLGIVTPLSATESNSGESFGGISREIFEDCIAASLEYCVPKGHTVVSDAINPQITKYVLLKKCLEAGVEVQFHTTLTGAETQNSRIVSINVFTKSGYRQIKGKAFIDGTGDGDLIALSGAAFSIGSKGQEYEELAREDLAKVHFDKVQKEIKVEEKRMQPVSIFFKLRGVDVSKGASYNNKRLTFEDLNIDREAFRQEAFYGTCGFEENGDLIPLPQGRILISHGTTEDTAVVNMSRVIGINGADADSLNKGECLAQLQVIYLVDFLRKYVPGFEQAYLTESAVTLGVRETRRLKGKYELTGTDAIQCRSFEDAVARGSYIIDIHDPMGKNKAIGGSIKGDYYEIPLRCLESETYDNLLACGRCISADHVAHSSTRIQGTCMLTGQAAGTAAVCLARDGKICAGQVREWLKEDGVRL